ncbi:Retrovirus-related Pol polyprotein from transposon TNT 1-94-like protein [Drosera capensis]
MQLNKLICNNKDVESISCTFLHSDLIETVYMFQPPGYETTGENHVCRLRKSLYGLKQSPRAWFEKFSRVVQNNGFSRSYADSSLFVHRRSQGAVVLLVYVDDIIITGDDTAGIAKMKSHLSKYFHTKDLGTLKYFLGIEIAKQGKSFIYTPRKSHLTPVEHILKYLKKSHEKGLIYRPTAIPSLTTYTDADYAGSPDDRRSTSGYSTYFGGNLIT